MFISPKLTGLSIGLVVLCLMIPFLVDLQVPLMDGLVVRYIENIQAIMLFIIPIFCFFYIRPLDCPSGKKQFWIWSLFLWIMLFGRSISWGRDYYPAIPHLYFRIVSIFFIAPVIFMLFSKKFRQETIVKFKTMRFPIYSFLVVLITLLIADTVEHSRIFASFFLHNILYRDFVEEMYEFPVILGLFEVTYLLMKQDKESLEIDL